MLHLIFAAHDPGAGKMLSGATKEARRRGHEIRFVCDGPAKNLWLEEGETVEHLDIESDRDIAQVTASTDLVVTGTGFGPFERQIWQSLRGHEQKTFAVIDSWATFKRRFIGDKQDERLILPDAIGVVDDWSLRQIQNDQWSNVPLHVVGQPHLQQITDAVLSRRRRRAANRETTLVFFSEPIREDFPDGSRGFEQFGVFSDVLTNLNDGQPLRVLVKPHPRELSSKWEKLVTEWPVNSPLKLELSEQNADDLLGFADGVIGMTTMVLVEAALSRVPTVSCQPDRGEKILPFIDEILPVVTNMSDFNDVIRLALSGELAPDEHGEPNVALSQIIENAAGRFVDAIELVAGKRN